MRVSRSKKSIISLESLHSHFTLLCEKAQHCRKFISIASNAHTPFLKSRLHYLMFMLFFIIYSLSPLKVCADRTVRGLLQNSEDASIQIVMVERVLNLITNGLSAEGLFNVEDADIEVMVKKKRALLRAFTLFFLLLIAIATHIAARYCLRSDQIMPPGLFRQSHNAGHISIAEVYPSPYSGLAPPCLFS